MSAHMRVAQALRRGDLTRATECSECGNGDVRIVAHHDDYSQPLDVRWLCDSCHRRWHVAHGPAPAGADDVTVTARVDEATHRRLKIYAQSQRRSVSNQIRVLIEDAIDAEEREQAA